MEKVFRAYEEARNHFIKAALNSCLHLHVRLNGGRDCLRFELCPIVGKIRFEKIHNQFCSLAQSRSDLILFHEEIQNKGTTRLIPVSSDPEF